jgi:uncharacterized protein (TIGR04222 family)
MKNARKLAGFPQAAASLANYSVEDSQVKGAAMNPFDWPGLVFLSFYFLLFLLGLATAVWLRWRLRLPPPDEGAETPQLEPYQVAYLAGGPVLALNAVLSRLAAGGYLVIEPKTLKMTSKSDLPDTADSLEKAVFAEIGLSDNLRALRRQTGSLIDRLADPLHENGLLVPPERSLAARLVPVMVMLGVAMIGLIKIVVGAERHRPVGFLIIGCIVTVVAGLVGFARPVFRSRRGDDILDRLRRENAPLQTMAAHRAENLRGTDLTLAVALFGLGVLSLGPLADLRKMLQPPMGSSGSCGGGGSWGGGGCGGGGCGGGCGGCGGGD